MTVEVEGLDAVHFGGVANVIRIGLGIEPHRKFLEFGCVFLLSELRQIRVG